MHSKIVEKIARGGLAFIKDEVRSINSGGCGMFAKELAHHFEKLDIPYTIQCIGYGEKMEEEEVLEAIRNDDSWDVPNCHIIIESMGMQFDSNGYASESDTGNVAANISLATLEEMLDGHFWNSAFDRNVEMPYVTAAVSDFFESSVRELAA